MTFKTEIELVPSKSPSTGGVAIYLWVCPLCGRKMGNPATPTVVGLAKVYLIHDHKVLEEMIEFDIVPQAMCKDMIGIGGAGMSVQCTHPVHGEEYLHQAIYEDDFLGQKVLMTWS